MLYRTLPDKSRVYPNAKDLAESPNRWYPSISNVLAQVRHGQLRPFDIFLGHYPFFVAKEIFHEECITFAFFRDPVARTVSMLKHRKRSNKKYSEMSYEELLEDEQFVRRQLANYQTKVFAFSKHHPCRDSVNEPLKINEKKYALALEHLHQLHVIGLTEEFAKSIHVLEQRTGLSLGAPLVMNVSEPSEAISEELRAKIVALNYYDMQFYNQAKKLFLKQSAISVEE